MPVAAVLLFLFTSTYFTRVLCLAIFPNEPKTKEIHCPICESSNSRNESYNKNCGLPGASKLSQRSFLGNGKDIPVNLTPQPDDTLVDIFLDMETPLEDLWLKLD